MMDNSMSEFKPKATILLLAYNQEKYIVQAAQSCLNQQGDPIEIIFSDDCSTDSTYALLQQVANDYKGPHHLVIRQNDCNLGIAEHYNILVELAKGQLLITAAGDDISYIDRAQTLVNAWEASDRKLDLIASYAYSISENDYETGALIKVAQLANWKCASDWCVKRPYVVGATHAFTKRIWTTFGNISPNIFYEDQIVSLRAICLGGGLTIERPLLSYRSGGVSSKDNSNGRNDKLLSFHKRYTRQSAVFSQIHLDLQRANYSSLWKGKVKRYWARAQAALHLLKLRQEHLIPSPLQFIQIAKECGFLWTIRNIVFIWT